MRVPAHPFSLTLPSPPPCVLVALACFLAALACLRAALDAARAAALAARASALEAIGGELKREREREKKNEKWRNNLLSPQIPLSLSPTARRCGGGLSLAAAQEGGRSPDLLLPHLSLTAPP